MNEEKRKLAADIGDEALDIEDRVERETFIEKRCAGDPELEQHVRQYLVDAEESDDPFERYLGKQIGSWTLTKILGSGGFGIVFLAERKNPNQRAAIKLLQGTVRSRDVEARFRQEQQALAKLSHPCIVHLKDVGVTPEGQPYLVMEYVEEAKPIDVYCRDRKLTIRQKIELFEKVCEAVSSAHQKLIIHRDLKPSNILVGADGSPKLLDFNLAKLLDPLEQASERDTTRAGMGTERYMSPEQVRGEDITTTTDVYSLAVVLYELLTGTDPYNFESRVREEVDRIICEIPPEAPSQAIRRSAALTKRKTEQMSDSELKRLQRELMGDLDIILQMALRKEPERRYQSVEALKADLQNHMNLEPVKARPDSLGYRTGCFVRRNKGKLGIAVFIFVLLVAGLIAINYQRQQAIINEHRATENEKNADAHARREAENAHVAMAREIASYSTTSLAEDPGRSLVLAMYAVDATLRYGQPPLNVAANALRTALLQSRLKATFRTAETGFVVFGPDGKSVMTGGQDSSAGIDDNTATVRGTDSGRVLLVLREKAQIYNAVFSPDGTCIATATEDGSVNVWDASSGLEKLSIKEPGVKSVAFSPDGHRVLTISLRESAFVKIWDTRSGREVLRFRVDFRGTFSPPSAIFSPDGRRVATTGGAEKDMVAEIWDAASGSQLQTVRTHDLNLSRVNDLGNLAFSPDGKYLAVGSSDGTAMIFYLYHTGDGLVLQPGEKEVDGKITLNCGGCLRGVAFSSDGQHLATSSDQAVKIWDFRTGRELLRMPGHKGRVTGVSFSPDGKLLSTVALDDTIRIWDAEGPTEVMTTLTGVGVGDIYDVAFNPDGKLLAMAGSHFVSETGLVSTTAVWDVTHRRLSRMLHHKDEDHAVVFAPDGRRLATATGDGQVRIWEVPSGRQVLALSVGVTYRKGISFGPEGRTLATIGNEEAKLWDMDSGHSSVGLNVPHVTAIAYSPDGKRLATASADHTAAVRDPRSGRVFITLVGHRQGVSAVAFSSDGRRIATASADGTAKIWEVASGRELLTLGARPGPLLDVKFSPNGKWIATAGLSDTTRLWDATTGAELLDFVGQQEGHPLAVAFSPDGRFLATGNVAADVSSIPRAQIHLIDVMELMNVAKNRMWRHPALTPEECEQYLHLDVCPPLP